jgi:flagellar assembly factor FliW
MSSDASVAALRLPEGLVGLASLVSFEVRPVGDGTLVELVSLDDPSFGWIAAPADAVRDGIHRDLAARGLVGPGERVVVLLATHGDPPVVTANLAGPIVINPDGAGRQLVLEDPDYPIRATLGTDA